MFKSDCRNLIVLAMFLAMPLTLAVAQTCRAQNDPYQWNTSAPSSAAPSLPGSSVDYGPPSMAVRAPSLQGHTNGLIGPPGIDATMIGGGRWESAPEQATSGDKQWIGVIAVALAALFAFLLGRRKKSCVWALGASTAAIMVIAGLAWGTFGMTH